MDGVVLLWGVNVAVAPGDKMNILNYKNWSALNILSKVQGNLINNCDFFKNLNLC